MKIILLHGDNEIKSYGRLLYFIDIAKGRGWEILHIDNKLQNLQGIIRSQGLFKNSRLLILENITLLSKKDLSWLKVEAHKFDDTLVIFHRQSLTQTYLKSLPKIDKIEENKMPKLIWTFMESFYPGNLKSVLKLLSEIEKNDNPEMVFYFLVKHLKDVYWAKVDAKNMPYLSWRSAKLSGQARKFKDGKLEEIILEMAKIDLKVKTSKAELKDELDFLIVSKLE